MAAKSPQDFLPCRLVPPWERYRDPATNRDWLWNKIDGDWFWEDNPAPWLRDEVERSGRTRIRWQNLLTRSWFWQPHHFGLHADLVIIIISIIIIIIICIIISVIISIIITIIISIIIITLVINIIILVLTIVIIIIMIMLIVIVIIITIVIIIVAIITIGKVSMAREGRVRAC